MEVIEAIHSWRSIRSFAAPPVERAEIADLLWHAVQVPTPPANETPWALCVVEGQVRIEELGLRAMDYARAHRPPGEPGWSWVDRPGFKVFWGAPAIVLICARCGNAEAPFDCCRAGQNLVLAAHARGYGTCWLGAPLPWLRSAGVAEGLGVPAGFAPSVVIALGRPAQSPEPKSRPHPDIVWCPGG